MEEAYRITDTDFYRLSELIYNDYGIQMPITKKIMLESRLRKRLKAIKIDSFEVYVNYIFSPEGVKNELVHMIDAISTNKTDFFREPGHFQFMTETLLPEFQDEKSSNALRVWSSAASTGEEAYTIAMVIEEFLKNKRAFDYSIYCTDISTEALKKAVDGIYTYERISNISLDLKRKYFLKSKDKDKPTVRMIPALRKKLSFNRMNLIDDIYRVPYEFDVIFCRNVLIYFDKPTQEKVINKLCKKLKKGGIFFLGHSESLTGMDTPLKTIIPTVFIKE